MHHLCLFPHFQTKMEDFFERFPHVTQQILKQLDKRSLKNCREVASRWQECIDDNNFLWIRIVKIPKIPKNGDTYLHIATKSGQTKIVETLMQKSKEMDFDLNATNEYGKTAFHLACMNRFQIAKIIVENSNVFKIDLNARDLGDGLGMTGFH